MKRVLILLSLLLLTVPAAAVHVPDDVITENRDGRQLIIKTYTLGPEDDPAALLEEPFELEGFSYRHLDTTKEEHTFQESRQYSETVTLETETDDLADILEQLSPTMEYSKDGFSGTLTLDHTTLHTEAAGYTTQHYTITDTKQITDLNRNDPSYVPTTSVKNGATLSLSGITWAVTGTGLADDTLVPTSYTATATYKTTGSRQVATSYVTTVNYTGEVSARGVESIEYTVSYLGTPLEPERDFSFLKILLPAIALLVLLVLTAVYLFTLRPNTTVYAMNAKGVAYKKLGRQRISAKSPRLDFTKLKEYPAGDASVELESGIAHRLAGRIVSIQLYDGTRTHLIEQYQSSDNYWFAVKDNEQEEAE